MTSFHLNFGDLNFGVRAKNPPPQLRQPLIFGHRAVAFEQHFFTLHYSLFGSEK
jgi:hypothetical protein